MFCYPAFMWMERGSVLTAWGMAELSVTCVTGAIPLRWWRVLVSAAPFRPNGLGLSACSNPILFEFNPNQLLCEYFENWRLHQSQTKGVVTCTWTEFLLLCCLYISWSGFNTEGRDQSQKLRKLEIKVTLERREHAVQLHPLKMQRNLNFPDISLYKKFIFNYLEFY